MEAKNKPFKNGDVVVYVPKGHDGVPYVVEIGIFKKYTPNGNAFVYYHSGDTTASTNLDDLMLVENGYQIEALAKRRKELLISYKED